MHAQCPHCALTFEREQGYFVGAIYVNYAATTLIAIAGLLLLWGSFAILFPLFFFRYSRSLWLSLDYLFNPAELPASNNLSILKRKSDQ
jgi:hypothetical protein